MSGIRRSFLYAKLLDAGAIPDDHVPSKVTFLDTDEHRDMYRVARRIVLGCVPDAARRRIGVAPDDFELVEVDFGDGEYLTLYSPDNPPSLDDESPSDDLSFIRRWARSTLSGPESPGAERAARIVLALVGADNEPDPIASRRRALQVLPGGKGAA